MAVVSKRLGHSTLALTSDTYSHMFEGIGRDAAERASALVPRVGKAEADSCDQSVTNDAPGSEKALNVNFGSLEIAGLDCAP